jgi:hypothetical protein
MGELVAVLRSPRIPIVAIALAIGLNLVTVTAEASPLLEAGTEVLTLNSVQGLAMHGYDFISNTNQLVTALGFWDEGSNGLPQSFQVGLWATTTQTLLASAVIDNSDLIDSSVTVANGSWRYETLVSPAALSSGTTYTLGFYVSTPAVSASDTLLLRYSTLGVDPTVTVLNQSRFQPSAAFTFPTGVVAGNDAFRGNVNAQLAAVPAPASLTLVMLGTVAVAAIRLAGSLVTRTGLRRR